MEKDGVSIGMFQTSYLSFDVRRTERVGQIIFSVMQKKHVHEGHSIFKIRTQLYELPWQLACFGAGLPV